MKRVVEEVTELDTQIGSLFEEGQSKTTNSDRSIFLLLFKLKTLIILCFIIKGNVYLEPEVG